MKEGTTTREIPSPEAPGLDPERICTLPGDALAERLAWIRDQILPHATRTVRHPRGLDIELEAAPGLAARLDRLVALERECCGGISFRRAGPSEEGGLRLEIRGADPDAPVFRRLGAGRGAMPRRGSRALKATGFGALAGLFVCCVVPLAAAALIGSAAAPLAGLDHPAPIAGGALVGGLAAWWWSGRRATTAAARAASGSTRCGPGC